MSACARIDADEIRTRAGNAHSLSRRTIGRSWRGISLLGVCLIADTVCLIADTVTRRSI